MPAERKLFPEDLLASVRDGRLARECAAMRQASPYRVVIVERQGSYTIDNHLRIKGRPSDWTKAGVRNLLGSIRYVEGCDIEFSDDILDTIEVLKEIQRYFDEEKHLSLRIRSKFESNWVIPIYEERLTHFYQGLPGISIILARKLAEKFPNPMSLFSASVEDIDTITLFGRKRAERIMNFLHGKFE